MPAPRSQICTSGLHPVAFLHFPQPLLPGSQPSCPSSSRLHLVALTTPSGRAAASLPFLRMEPILLSFVFTSVALFLNFIPLSWSLWRLYRSICSTEPGSFTKSGAWLIGSATAAAFTSAILLLLAGVLRAHDQYRTAALLCRCSTLATLLCPLIFLVGSSHVFRK